MTDRILLHIQIAKDNNQPMLAILINPDKFSLDGESGAQKLVPAATIEEVSN